MPECILKAVPEWRSLKDCPEGSSRPRERRCCDINMPSLANVNTFGHLIVAVRGRSRSPEETRMNRSLNVRKSLLTLGAALPLLAGPALAQTPPAPTPPAP